MGKLSNVRSILYNNRVIIAILIASLSLKLALFAHISAIAPSSKFMPDTPTYIEPGLNLVEKGVFANFDDDGRIEYEILRTPGYPVFVAFLKSVLGMSFGHIIVIQILLITLAGYIVYKAAMELDKNIAFLAAIMFLFDQPTTLSALMLLTEALYTVFIAFFMLFFLKYLKTHRISSLVLAGLILAMGTYIKPVSYYLGTFLAGGIIYALFRGNIRKAVVHALIFLLVFYSLLGLWQYRNYARTGNSDFTTIGDIDLENMGLTHHYARFHISKNITMDPFPYYVAQTSKSFIQFFTLPSTFKNFNSKPLKIASKVYGYLWVVFWLTGFLFAVYDKLCYKFILLNILYFALVSVVVTGLCVGSRFRVPVMPLISILSASGWIRILGIARKRFSVG